MIGDTLSVLLPTPDETALLGACLGTGTRARDAWARWHAGRAASDETICHHLAATRTLMPLLARSVARHDLEVERGVLGYLRATTLREEIRSVRYRQIAVEALAALEREGVTAYVVRGAALAATVYPAWSQRHCHDLDLIVRREELGGAVRALTRIGGAPIGPTPGSRMGALVRHPSGLHFSLHTRPFAVAYYDLPVERFAGHARSITIDGVSARIPSPEAILLHVLGHATYSSSRRNLRWVADVWHLVAHQRDLDWAEVLMHMEACRLTLPVSVLLAYLADFGLAVPPEVLSRVRDLAAAPARAEEDVALGGAHAGPRGDLRSLWRSTPTWRGRVRVARWAVAPTPAYLQSAFPLPSIWLYPLCYLYRPARFVLSTLFRRAGPPPAPHGV